MKRHLHVSTLLKKTASRMLATLICCLAAGHALSATFTCGSSGYCLQDAITEANDNDEPDIIILGPGPHRPAPRLRYGEDDRVCLPPISTDITIRGAGKYDTSLIVRPTHDDCRVFQVYQSGRLILEDLSVEGGFLLPSTPDWPDSMGGAIHNAGYLLMRRVSIRRNNAPYAGGGLYNAPGSEAVVEDCEFTGNKLSRAYAHTTGSAIFNEGKIDINRCIVTGNDGTYIGKAIANSRSLTRNADVTMSIRNSVIESNHGGGVSNQSRYGSKLTIIASSIRYNSGRNGGGVENSSTAKISDTTIAFNTSRTFGGGIYTTRWHDASSLELINSTISGNYSMAIGAPSSASVPGGGGIFAESGGVSIINSTVASNRSQTSGGGLLIGHEHFVSDAEALIKNSIIAGNVSERSVFDDCSVDSSNAPITLVGNNIFGDDTGCPQGEANAITVPADNIFRELFGVLRDNGGSTDTHALLPGSPAIDGADSVCTDIDGEAITRDQRGYLRNECDIGAFELAPANNTVIKSEISGGNEVNRVNPRSNARLRITMLSDLTEGSELEPTTEVVKTSLRVGNSSTELFEFIESDVNGDGVSDLTVTARARDLGIEPGDSELTLTGSLTTGATFVSLLPIVTIGK